MRSPIHAALISVIIPSYNSEKWVTEAIDSALAQSHSNLEVIVVDDGSTDGTRTLLLEKYQGRIRYHYQSNHGLAGARNTGLALAKGSYVQFLDADDLLRPDKLSRQLDCFAANPGCAVVHSDFDYFSDGVPYSSAPSPPQFVAKRAATDTFGALLSGNFIVVHAALCRRDAIVRVGQFDDALARCEDYDLWLRMAHRGDRFAFCEGSLLRYRKRAGSLSSDIRAQILASLEVLAKVPTYASLDRHQKLIHARYISELVVQLDARSTAPPRRASDLRASRSSRDWMGRGLRKIFAGLT